MSQSDTTWNGPVPVSRRFDDPYYSLENGIAETTHVFVQGNRIPERLGAPLHIAELGFGTGLNLLTTWALWAEGPRAPLHFTSFEAFPMAPDTRTRALRAFPTLAPLAARLGEALAHGEDELAPNLRFTLIEGDARQTLPAWDGQADAWYLDGFSPAKNPELWDAALMRAVGAHTRPGGSFATYTAAGHVRRALAEAGFAVTRQPGYGRKRHMSIGRLTP